MNFRYGRILILCALTTLSACGNDVTISNKEWDCEGNRCDVSFVLTNNAAAEIEASYAVRAQSAIQTITSNNQDGLVVAEIQEKVPLSVGEQKRITHTLDASRPPTNVVISAWVK